MEQWNISVEVTQYCLFLVPVHIQIECFNLVHKVCFNFICYGNLSDITRIHIFCSVCVFILYHLNWPFCLCDQIMAQIPIPPVITLMAAYGVNIFHMTSSAVLHFPSQHLERWSVPCSIFKSLP